MPLSTLILFLACGGDVPPERPPPGDTDTGTSVVVPTGDTGSTGDTAPEDPEPTGDTGSPPTGSTGDTGDTALPTSWRMVEAGQSATCGLDQDGEAYCLEDGPFSLPAPPAGPFVDLAVAFGTACALDEDGAIVCWGCDFVASMCTPPSDTGYVQIEGADSYLCARKADDTVDCWGDGPSPRAQDTFLDFDLAVTGFSGLLPDGSHRAAGEEAPDLPGTGYVDIGAGRSFACALDAAGENTCSRFAPQGLPTTGLSQIDGMSDTFCWLDIDGHVGCWPQARHPTLARDGFDPSTTEFVSVSAGDKHACGTTTSGEGYCWPAGEVFTTWPQHP